MEETKKTLTILGYKIDEINYLINNKSIKKQLDHTINKRIKENYEYLSSIGYNNEQIKKMSLKFVNIYAIDKSTLNDKYKFISSISNDSKSIIYKLPQILGYSIETMNKRINNLKKYSFTNDEIVKIINSYPQILGLSILNTQKKLDFYIQIGLREVIIKDSKQLMQGFDTSLARYKFFKDQNIEIDMTNYRLLFYTKKQLFNRFNVTDEYLKETYLGEKNERTL